jgi:maltose-binding protein MalE
VHRNVESPPGLPEYPAMNEVLSDMTKFALSGAKGVEEALRDASQACEQILAGAGHLG